MDRDPQNPTTSATPNSNGDFALIGGKVRTATTSSSIINLTNTIIGAGMLGLPYAVAVCGLLFGLTMLVLRYRNSAGRRAAFKTGEGA